MARELESWHSDDYVSEWLEEDVLADLLELPRRISVALVADAGIPVSHVVDLGSGHGPYLALLLDSFCDARGTWVDSSEAMLEHATHALDRFGERVRYVVAEVERLDDAGIERADVVVTSRMLHHLSAEVHATVYTAVRRLLAPGGFFFNLDHIGVPDDWDAAYRRIRPQFTGARSRPLAPHRHDFALSAADAHLRWLAAAGFETFDVPWRTFYTALLVARRGA